MSDEVFNVFSAVGIGLTFLASMAAVVVSVISLRCSNKAAKRSGYLSTITASRDRWSNSLRENASLYFTQIARICSGQEDNLGEIYNELTHYHFAIILLFFEQDKELHNSMSALRSKAFEVVEQNNIIVSQYNNRGSFVKKTEIENSDIVIQARKKMHELRCIILEKYQEKIFNEISVMLEIEWRKHGPDCFSFRETRVSFL